LEQIVERDFTSAGLSPQKRSSSTRSSWMTSPTPKAKVVTRKPTALRVLEQIMEQQEHKSPELAAKQKRLLAVLAGRKGS
jgi:hypothetical protein